VADLNPMEQAERWLSYLTHDPTIDEETQAVYAATAQAWTLMAIFEVLKEMNASLKLIQTAESAQTAKR
jgi:hypothetical protein